MNIYAPAHLDIYDSYGIIACELLRGLDELGVRVNAIALGEPRHKTQPPDVARLTNRPIRPSYGGIFLGYPVSYQRHGPLAQVGTRIALTMFESSIIPGEWVPILNTMDAVIVPSEFCRDSFTDCGVDVPIHVVLLGINEIFQPKRRESGRPFTFLAIGDRGRRKGTQEAVQAFVHAFGDNPDVRLLIKVRDVGEQTVTILNNNIDIIRQDMTIEQLYNLYCDCDCMVFPTRGEGFGLPPREFAATGGIAIATNWGGTADHIEKWGIPLDYTLTAADWQGAKNLQGKDLGVWAEPSILHLCGLMTAVWMDKERFAHRALQQAPNIHDLYSWRGFSEAVLDIWEFYGNRVAISAA